MTRWPLLLAGATAALLAASCGTAPPLPGPLSTGQGARNIAAEPSGPPTTPGPGESAPHPTSAPARQPGLLLTEVSFVHAAGEFAFVELSNAGLVPVDPAGASLRLGPVELGLGGVTRPLAPGEPLLVLLDGRNEIDGSVVHASDSIELDAGSGVVELLDRDGVVLDRVAWGGSQPDGVPFGVGGIVPSALGRGATIGRAPGTTRPAEPGAWVPYGPADASPGRPNPVPTVGVLLPVSGPVPDGARASLAWYPVPGAVAYRVQVASDPTFASPIIDTRTPEPRIDSGPLAPGGYSWRVLAEATDGTVSRFSEASTFDLTGAVAGAIDGATAGVSAAGVGDVLFAADGPGRHLAVPLLSQHKDTAMLLLERNVESGAHAWDADHGVLDPRDPADNKSCAIASIAMANRFFGGDLSQDRIGYELFKDRQAGPEWDLPYGTGIDQAQVTGAMTFALGAAPVHMETGRSPDEVWVAVTASIDAGRPVVAAGIHHTVVFTGYQVRGGRRLLSMNDPWNYPGRSGRGEYDIDANSGRSAAVLDLWLPPAGARGTHQEASISTDSDGDGVVDFDETERFGTNPASRDGDRDGLPDKQDIVTGVFDETYGYALDPGVNGAGRDFDADGIPTERDADSDSGGCLDGDEDASRDGHRTGGETSSFDVSDDRCGGGVVTYVQTRRWSGTATNACPGDLATWHGTFRLSMVVRAHADGTATATVNVQRREFRQDEDHGCGSTTPVTYYVKTMSSQASGTRDAYDVWAVGEDGTLTFEAGWDPVTGTEQSTTWCAPIACDGSTTSDITSEFDNLRLEAPVDPTAAVITGSLTEDHSTAEGTDVTVYTWTLAR